jgi:hypothetical protein
MNSSNYLKLIKNQSYYISGTVFAKVSSKSRSISLFCCYLSEPCLIIVEWSRSCLNKSNEAPRRKRMGYSKDLNKLMANRKSANFSSTPIKRNRRPMLTMKKRCPGCGKISYYRIQREWWMRLLPGTRHYHCLECFERFVLLQTIL